MITNVQPPFLWFTVYISCSPIQCVSTQSWKQTHGIIHFFIHITYGVCIDSELKFALHVKRIAARCFYHLRQLWAIRRALSDDNAKMLVHALIASRVDYCNSILYRVAAVHLRPLQSVLNSAARLIVRKRKCDHITSTLRDDLPWLPVDKWTEFKLCLLVFKCQHQMAPPYSSLSAAVSSP